MVADLGPSLPFHDLAHFVVETSLGLEDGFFANVARGYSPEQLSDKATILSLGPAPYRAEILARALGSLSTGACAPEEFEELVNMELSGLSLATMRISPEMREQMMAQFKTLTQRYAHLQEGEGLRLEFNPLRDKSDVVA